MASKTPLPPGPQGGIFLSFRLARDGMLSSMAQLAQSFGDIVRLDLGVRRFTIVNSPEFARYVLQENNANYKKAPPYEEASLLLGNGLLNSEGNFWRRQRRLVQPAFQKTAVKEMGPAMQTWIDSTTNRWQSALELGDRVDVHKDMMSLTLEIISETMFGAQVLSKEDSVRNAIGFANEYISDRISAPFSFPVFIPVPDNIRFWWARHQLDSVVNGIIRNRAAEGPKGTSVSNVPPASDAGPAPSPRPDLLARLMAAVEEGDQGSTGGDTTMSPKQLRDEVMTIFLAGHETTAIALTMCLYLLAANPQKKSVLNSEVHSLLGRGKKARSATSADVDSLTYTCWVVKEAMRLYPPAWIMGRTALTEDQIGGYSIPAGEQVSILPWLLHRDSRYWREPEMFLPERFQPSEEKERPNFAYIPFGGGPRTCVGMGFAMQEMIMAIATLAARFDFELEPGYKMEVLPFFTLRPKNPLKLTLREPKN